MSDTIEERALHRMLKGWLVAQLYEHTCATPPLGAFLKTTILEIDERRLPLKAHKRR
jgi:hypothetical protein